jgi:hypothetical protein
MSGFHSAFESSLAGLADQVKLATAGRFVRNFALGDVTLDFAVIAEKVAIDFSPPHAHKFEAANRAGWTLFHFSKPEIRSGIALDILRRAIAERRRLLATNERR